MSRPALLVLALATGAAAASAQTPNAIRIGECAKPGVLALSRGRVLVVDCDSAFVFNAAAQQIQRRRLALTDSLLLANAAVRRANDSLTSALRELTSVLASINATRAELIGELHAIHRIDSIAYDSLRALQTHTDSLARASTRNTDRALSYVKKVRAMSYVASTVGGGLVGGLGGSEGGGWSWPWCGVGAGVGLLVNLGLQKLIH